MRKQEKKRWSFIYTVKEHVENNKKSYIIASVIFIIGVVIGVIFINQIEEETQNQIGSYINTFVECLNSDYEINKQELLRSSIISNMIFVFLIWFIGSTVIGIPIVYLLIAIKGFSLSYTISSILITFGTGKGILFSLASLLFQNIIIIPCILALAVSGMKLYKSIMKDKNRENIKVEIIRHTIFSLFISVFYIMSSFVEVYVSSNLITLCVSYIA